jgi:hypothetical protein
MSRRLAVLTVAALSLILAAAFPAFAAKGGGSAGAQSGSKTSTTISFAPTNRLVSTAVTNNSSVSFTVTSSALNKTLLVVTNRCWRDGAVVYNEYKAVGSDGLAGPFTLTASGTGDAKCEAFVWEYPDPTVPLSGGSMAYDLS